MKHIIISGLYLLTLFCISTFVFDPAYLYYELRWLDIPMHIMGGFGVAAFVGSIFSYRGVKVSYVQLMIAYLVVAILWEGYEHTLNVVHEGVWYGEREPIADILDTIKDLVDGAIGMSVAYLFIRK